MAKSRHRAPPVPSSIFSFRHSSAHARMRSREAFGSVGGGTDVSRGSGVKGAAGGGAGAAGSGAVSFGLGGWVRRGVTGVVGAAVGRGGALARGARAGATCDAPAALSSPVGATGAAPTLRQTRLVAATTRTHTKKERPFAAPASSLVEHSLIAEPLPNFGRLWSEQWRVAGNLDGEPKVSTKVASSKARGPNVFRLTRSCLSETRRSFKITSGVLERG